MSSPVLPALLGAAGGALAAAVLLTLAAPAPSPAPGPSAVLDRLDALTVQLGEVVEGLRALPVGSAPTPTPIPARRRADPEPTRLAAVTDRLSALVATLDGRRGRTPVRPPDPRERRSPIRWNEVAELARRAEEDHATAKRQLMLCSMAEIIALYGFPTDVYSHASIIQLAYHREGMANAWFNFRDGLLVEFGAAAQ